jgi:hypothetical protein
VRARAVRPDAAHACAASRADGGTHGLWALSAPARRDSVADTGEDLGSSDKTLRAMYLQSLLSGGIWWLLAAVVAASILLLLWAKLRSLGMVDKPHAPPPPHPPPPYPPRLALVG